MNTKEELLTFFESAKHGKMAILCVGNELRGDDRLGPYIAKELEKIVIKGVEVFNTGNQPENFLAVLARKKITHCLIIDAVEFHEEPGTIGFFDPSDLKEYQVTFSTHFLSMKVLIDVFGKNTGATFKILGVQPKQLNFGSDMTKKVQESASEIINFLITTLA